ncbi:hypothetical protein KP509_18G030500 [Ceratopteris richardii]|nr:hypothetical protein KP509_18G030500 [Ceratopteris richardii]KAH7365480.1 hypothetical protein KP509_18G030500 [Ceratopteris richardii]KAH7365483.1 hypothetical protein KP509_18G030500 [Ceratopteris richardii]
MASTTVYPLEKTFSVHCSSRRRSGLVSATGQRNCTHFKMPLQECGSWKLANAIRQIQKSVDSKNEGIRPKGSCRSISAISSPITTTITNDAALKTKVDEMLSTIKWDKSGLVVAIAQHIDTGAVLMQGFANSDAILATIASGKATFFSRSRSSLWTKGETSSNFINVKDVFLDCDRDSIIYLGLPDGPTCHTGATTCYFTRAPNAIDDTQDTTASFPLTTLFALEETIHNRKSQLMDGSVSKPSWTHKLMKDHELLCSKIREEADELCRTLESNEGKDRTASEMADVLYHSMVLLAVQDVKLEDVLEILRKRFTQSGIEEKSSRK